MARSRLIWKTYLPFVAFVLLSALVLALVGRYALRQYYLRQTEMSLRTSAAAMSSVIGHSRLIERLGDLGAFIDDAAEGADIHFTIIGLRGEVLADSHRGAATIPNQLDRPEVAAALRGRGESNVESDGLFEARELFVAQPIRHGDRVVGVVKAAIALSIVEAGLQGMYFQLSAGAAVVIIIGCIGGFVTLRNQVAVPLERVYRSVLRLARGRLETRVPDHNSREIGGIAESLNAMAAYLAAQMNQLTAESTQRQAIFSSMIEGVIAVDRDERIISMNQAAGRIVGARPGEATGRTIPEVIRNAELLRFAARAVESDQPIEGEVALETDRGWRHLQTQGTVLRDLEGRAVGAVIVLHDVTRLRQLESMQRDFVANVSHELKTPITSIRGFLETLNEGAIEEPDHARRFLQIMSRQADRLEAIIEDLLMLSRLERDGESDQVEREEVKIHRILEAAVADCRARAEEAAVEVVLDCPATLMGFVNSRLLEQAVVNLVDNAIKYSGRQTVVTVTAQEENDQVVIRVIDQGPGIERKHHAKLFDRFYRVDKGRSRMMGGTGLGLAITRHIALVHRGTVRIDSTPGQGSTFSIHIPVE